jgi:hypothetical protein
MRRLCRFDRETRFVRVQRPHHYSVFERERRTAALQFANDEAGGSLLRNIKTFTITFRRHEHVVGLTHVDRVAERGVDRDDRTTVSQLRFADVVDLRYGRFRPVGAPQESACALALLRRTYVDFDVVRVPLRVALPLVETMKLPDDSPL